VPKLKDYLNPSDASLRQQWETLMRRSWAAPGKRQSVFLPVETVLCLAASLRVNHRRFGSSTADGAPSPVPELANLFKRPNSSVLAKMANLDGSRSHGGKFDQDVACVLRDDLEKLGSVYRAILRAARDVGIDARRLPDFLGVENGGVPKDRVVY
jgi:putative restriction endonuclease